MQTRFRPKGLDYHEFPAQVYPRLTHFGFCRRGEHLDIGDHHHFGFEVFAMTWGAALLRTGAGRKPLPFAVGEVLVIPPGSRHAFRLDHPEVEYYWLGFQAGKRVVKGGPTVLRRGDAVATRRLSPSVPMDLSLRRITGYRWPGVVKLTGSKDLEASFAAIKSALDHPDDFQAEKIYGRIVEIFSAILERLSHKSVSAPSRDSLVERVEKHLRNHPEDGASLKDLADRVGVHESTLSRRFHGTMGVTLVRFALETRVRKTATLLEKGKTVAQAAEAGGFENLTYFSTAFKKLMGVSPRDYQKTIH